MVDSNNINQRISVIILWALIVLCSEQVLAKSRVPISDSEIKEKKNECYADIESGIWGQQCTSSMIAKENCALQCLSPVCYELIYESDPLEEGEKDYTEEFGIQVLHAQGISWREFRWYQRFVLMKSTARACDIGGCGLHLSCRLIGT